MLGDVITTDKCISSYYGDTRLFFKHQWIEADAELKPEWKDAYFSECYCNRPWIQKINLYSYVSPTHCTTHQQNVNCTSVLTNQIFNLYDETHGKY